MIAVAVAFMLSAAVFAEESDKKERSLGYVTGGFDQLLCSLDSDGELSLSLLFQGFIAVGCGTEKNLGDGLGGVGDGGVYDAGLHGDAVDCRKRESDDEVECANAAWNGNCETKSADKGKEQGINYIQMAEEGCGPDGACCHEPVHTPDENGVGEEHPFAFHAKAA